MEVQVRVVIYALNNNVYDHLIITNNFVTDYKKYHQILVNSAYNINAQSRIENNENFAQLKLTRRCINAYLISLYVYTLKRSHVYRQAALRTLLDFSQSKIPKDKNAVIYIKLKMPRRQWLDYQWNDRVIHMALERRELDHAMSWLSTLGGGFSALGETFEHCAEMAGKISIGQLRLALRLGDPLLVARCKLWAALSLLQRGCLTVARDVIRETYDLAVREKDARLENMCKGVWAKLQYSYKMKRQLRTLQ